MPEHTGVFACEATREWRQKRSVEDKRRNTNRPSTHVVVCLHCSIVAIARTSAGIRYVQAHPAKKPSLYGRLVLQFVNISNVSRAKTRVGHALVLIYIYAPKWANAHCAMRNGYWRANFEVIGAEIGILLRSDSTPVPMHSKHVRNRHQLTPVKGLASWFTT